MTYKRWTALLTVLVCSPLILFLSACNSSAENEVAPNSLPTTRASPLQDNAIPQLKTPQSTPAEDVNSMGIPPETGISREEDSQLMPLYPSQVKATRGDNHIVLSWIGTGSDIIGYYLVYRKHADTGEWELLDRVDAIGDNRGQYEYQDAFSIHGVAYIYAVTAIDIYGNESELSETSTVEQ